MARLLSAFFTTCAFAADEIVASGDYEYSFNDDGITIIRYTGDEENELIVPDSIDGNKVTVIGKGAFLARRFTIVVLPDTVHEIQNLAFSLCDNLKTVSLPCELKKIDNTNPFSQCSSLCSFSISKEVFSFPFTM